MSTKCCICLEEFKMRETYPAYCEKCVPVYVEWLKLYCLIALNLTIPCLDQIRVVLFSVIPIYTCKKCHQVNYAWNYFNCSCMATPNYCLKCVPKCSQCKIQLCDHLDWSEFNVDDGPVCRKCWESKCSLL